MGKPNGAWCSICFNPGLIAFKGLHWRRARPVVAAENREGLFVIPAQVTWSAERGLQSTPQKQRPELALVVGWLESILPEPSLFRKDPYGREGVAKRGQWMGAVGFLGLVSYSLQTIITANTQKGFCGFVTPPAMKAPFTGKLEMAKS